MPPSVLIAVQIGVNTTAFTAYEAFVARPLDVRDSGKIVNLVLIHHAGVTGLFISYPD